MPDRIIKESITRSITLAELTFFEEVCFLSLTVKADDFGRFYRDPALLRCELFPRRKGLTEEEIEEAFIHLEKVGLIQSYTVRGESYLQIVTWADYQRVRASKSKYPGPDGTFTTRASRKKTNDSDSQTDDSNLTSNVRNSRANDSNSHTSADNRGQMPPNTNTKANAKTKTKEALAEDDDLTKEALAEDEDLIFIQADHNQIFDKARAIGLPCSQDNLDDLVDLYCETGLDAVLYGLNEARRLNKVSMAYISKVATNYRKDKPSDSQMSEDEANAILASLA